MPIITVQFIKDVVATPEQKRELVVRLTDTFVDILGEVVRPFVYCLIHETPQAEWAIAGVPMPDLPYLTGEKHAAVVARSNELMRQAIAAMQAQSQAQEQAAAAAVQGASDGDADKLWRGEAGSASDGRVSMQPGTAEYADKLWRGELEPSPASAAPSQRGAPAADNAQEHRALFARWFEELWNRKNYDIAYELVDPNFVAHGAGGQDIKQGPGGVIEMVKNWHRAMPDGRMTMDDIITEGDLSTIRMTWRGTHTGPFGDIPASGNKIEVTSIGIDRVVNGKITEGWGELNMLGMLQQMGAIPRPEAGAAQPAQAAASDPALSAAARNKAKILRLYEESNKGNVDYLDELLAPEFVSYGGAGFQDLHGPEAFKQLYMAYTSAFPDLQFEVQQIAAEGDLVMVRGVQTATHSGDFLGLAPATGKKVTWTGTAIFHFNDQGRVVERWQDLDSLGLLQQLDVIPQLGQVQATGTRVAA